MWIFSITLLVFSFHAHAQKDLAQLNPLSGRGFLNAKYVSPGDLVDLQLEVNLQDGFYAYHDKFSLKVIQPANVESGELFIHPIVKFNDSNSKKEKKRGP